LRAFVGFSFFTWRIECRRGAPPQATKDHDYDNIDYDNIDYDNDDYDNYDYDNIDYDSSPGHGCRNRNTTS
jgi:hypothetical protein